jgi:indole-3-glycerol phosphate synthase
MLEKFRAAKRAEIERLTALAHRGGLPPPLPGPRPSFSGAILDKAVPGKRAAVIAEYKRASPSKGTSTWAWPRPTWPARTPQTEPPASRC